MPSASGNPAISVLVPIYNVSKYLEECLSSLENQTFTDFEVICLNDGSTDNSPDIIASFVERDPRFREIDKPNSGYGDSMNRGLDEAKGDWIAILESDDRYYPNTLELLYTTATRYDAQMVKADFNLWWSEKDKLVRFWWTDEAFEGVTDPHLDPEVFFRKPSIWSALYKRSFLEENHIRFLPTPGASYQDAGFNFKVWASCTRAVLLNKTVLDYRQDNEASSVNSPSKVYCVCDEYAEMRRWLDERGMSSAWYDEIISRMQYDTYLWNYDRLNDELRPAWLERMRADFISDDVEGRSGSLYFHPEAWRYRELIIEDPALFESIQNVKQTEKNSKIDTLRTYLDQGDLKTAAKAYAYKIKGIL